MNMTPLKEKLFGEYPISFPIAERLSIVIGENGTGKSILLETLKNHFELKGKKVIYLADERFYSLSDTDTYWYIFEEESMKGNDSLFKKHNVQSDKIDSTGLEGHFIRSGKLQLVNIFCLLQKHRNEKLVVIIDEPERNLSITSQDDLLDDILSYANVENLIVATHSPCMIGDNHDSVFHIDRCVNIYAQ